MHAGHSLEMFRRKFWGTLLLSIPTVIWAPMIQHWFGYQALGGPGASRWISAAFGTLVFTYGGWVFIKGAIGELADRQPGMMTLIALAISVAFGFSLAVTFGFPGTDLWWELATLVTIMILGHWIEMRSISKAQGALKEPAKLLPDAAVRIVGEYSEVVPVSDLRDGDILLIRPCSSIPADGLVRDGSSEVNESMITGARLVPKTSESKVIAGTVNGSGSLRIEVTGTGEKTATRGIMRLVAQSPKLALPGASTRRPCSIRADHQRGRRGGNDAARLAVGWKGRVICGRTCGYGSRDRLSARVGARHFAGSRNIHNSRSP
jgi:Cu2+-exporting ATPase